MPEETLQYNYGERNAAPATSGAECAVPDCVRPAIITGTLSNDPLCRRHTVRCQHCAAEDTPAHLALVPPDIGDAMFCASCAQDGYYNCDSCNNTYAPGLYVSIPSGRSICPDCITRDYVSCGNCGALTHNHEAMDTPDGSLWCVDCYDDCYSVCTECDEVVPATHVAYSDALGVYACRACRLEAGDDVDDDYGENTINGYNYKPRPVFFSTEKEAKTPGNPLYFGFELEVELRRGHIREKCAGDVKRTVGDTCYLKSDGSLDNGFEVVSHPLTLEFIREKGLFEALEGHANALKAYHTTTCGYHVHLSKSAFTPYHLYKFMRFHYDNPYFIEYIAQRPSNHYTTMCPSAKVERMALHKRGNDNRYDAINLLPTNTVELRYFKANLKATRLYKNLEFITALYEFTDKTSANNLTASAFMAWLDTHRKTKRYSHLFKFLAQTNAPLPPSEEALQEMEA